MIPSLEHSPHGAETLYDRCSDSDLTVGHPGEVLGHLADLMDATDIGRVPIVDPINHHLVGLVARKDLLRIRSTVSASENDRRAFFGGRSRPGVSTV